ncbi:N-acetyltransferase family protein [Proteinivorax hydrogeniformans]|uniref:N-acetyltransferase family protein n=1 Tax=Proteinivorax hydrogeniformans TaxID=1826727 RepID=A0AAU8HVK4_9FIRM
MLLIRLATKEDVTAINRIYNQAVLTTVGTLDTEAKSIEKQIEWFYEHDNTYPVFVAVNSTDKVLGWLSLSKWSPKGGYRNTAELSMYVDENMQGQKIGSRLMEKAIKHGRLVNLHTILARIAGDNHTSIHLHKKHGFELIGVMKEVGFKFGRHVDIHLFQVFL